MAASRGALPSHVKQENIINVIRTCGFVSYSLRTTLFPTSLAASPPGESARVPENIIQFLREIAPLVHSVVGSRVSVQSEPAVTIDDTGNIIVPIELAWPVLEPARRMAAYTCRVAQTRPDLFEWYPTQDVAPGNLQQLVDAVGDAMTALVNACGEMYAMGLADALVVAKTAKRAPRNALRVSVDNAKPDPTKPVGIPNLLDDVNTWVAITRQAMDVHLFGTDEQAAAERMLIAAVGTRQYKPANSAQAFLRECNMWLALWSYMLTGNREELDTLCGIMRSFHLDDHSPHLAMRPSNRVEHTTTPVFVKKHMRSLEMLTYNEQARTWMPTNDASDYAVHVMTPLKSKTRAALVATAPIASSPPRLVFAHSKVELETKFGNPDLTGKCVYAAASLMYITRHHARLLLPVACLGDTIDTLAVGQAAHGNWLMDTAFVQTDPRGTLKLNPADIRIVLSVRGAPRYRHVPTFRPGDATWADQIRVFDMLLPQDAPSDGTWLVQLAPITVRVRTLFRDDTKEVIRKSKSEPLHVPVGMLAEDFGTGFAANTVYTITGIDDREDAKWNKLESQSGYFALQYCDRVADAATCTVASLLIAMLGTRMFRYVLGGVDVRLRVRPVPAAPDTDDHRVFPPADEFQRRQ